LHLYNETLNVIVEIQSSLTSSANSKRQKVMSMKAINTTITLKGNIVPVIVLTQTLMTRLMMK